MSRLILVLLVSLGWWLFIPIQAVRTETGDELHQEIEHLIEQLGNDDWHIREAATQSLIRRGEPARAAIKQARAHPDPEVRLRARYIFKQIKWGLSPALREKIGHLMDNYDRADEPTRQKIIGKLATHKELAAPVLVRILIYEESDRLCQLVFYLVQQWLDQPEIVSRARAILGKVNSFWALRMRGAIAEREKNLPQAIRYYEAAFQIKSSDRALVAQLYRLYEQTRQWDQAVALYQKLIELNPGETGYYFDLGRIYEKKGEPEQAHTTWNQILEIPGVRGTDYTRLITLYEDRGWLEKAIKVGAAGLKRFPEDTRIKFHLAGLYKQTDKVKEAIELWEGLAREPLKSRQAMLDILRELGACYFLKDDRTKTRQTWWRMIEPGLFGGSMEATNFHQLITVLETHNLADEVTKAYEQGVQAFPADINLGLGWVRLEQMQRGISPALTTLLDIYARHPETRYRADELAGIKDIFYDMCLVEPAPGQSAINLIPARLKGLAAATNQEDRLRQRRLSILLSWAYTLRDDYQKAGALARQALTYAPDSFDEGDFKELGEILRSSQQYDEAIAVYKKILGHYKNPSQRVEPYYRLGRCYYEKGEKEQARATWEKITEGPGITPGQFQRQMDIFLKYQLVDEAQALVEEWVKKYSSDKKLAPMVWRQAGRVAEKRDEVRPALDAYLKAKQSAVTEPASSDKMDEAIILLAQSCSEADVSGASLVDKIKKSFTGAEPEEAGGQYKAAGYVLQARLYQGQGDYQKAAEAMEQVLKVKPDDPASLYYLIDLYRQGGALSQALKRCEWWREIKPNEARSYYLTALVYQKKGDHAGADECLKQVRELTRSAAEGTHFQLGEFLKERGAVDWAQTEFETVLTKSPHNSINDANACGNLAQWAQEKEDYATALNYTRRERPIVRQENVVVLHDLDTFFRKVYFDIARVRKMDFFDSARYRLKGKLFHQQGELAPGNLSLSRALEIYPGNVTAFEEIAKLARENKFPQDKFKKLTRAIIKHYQHQIDTEPFSSIHYYHLANVYLILEEPVDEAIRLIKEALVLDPAVLEYQATRARLYAQQKRFQEARAIIKLLTNLKPDEKAYQELLEEVSKSGKDD